MYNDFFFVNILIKVEKSMIDMFEKWVVIYILIMLVKMLVFVRNLDILRIICWFV